MHMLIAQQLPMPQVSNSFFPLNPSLAEEMKRLFANLTIIEHVQSVPNVEDVMEEFRHNGRDYEYCPDAMEGSIETAPNPRRKKTKKSSPTECVFCRNNGEQESYYKEHVLKDPEGRVRCPVLRRYTCPICGASGDNAHTIKYCTQNSAYNSAGITSTVNAFKFLRNSSGRRRTK